MPAVLAQSPIERLKDRIDKKMEVEQPTPVERAIDRQSKVLNASVMMFADTVANAIVAATAKTEKGEEYEFTVSAHRPGEAYTVKCKRIK